MHAPGIPNLFKVGLQILVFEEIIIYKNILIFIWLNTDSQHNVVIFLVFLTFGIGPKYNRMPLHYMIFHPLQKGFILGLFRITVPFFVGEA